MLLDKLDKEKLSSHYWRVRVHTTNEEKVFSDFTECCDWARKVKHTLQDETMRFDAVEILEFTTII